MRVIVWMCLPLVCAAGCAHHVGKSSTQGMIESFEKGVDAEPGSDRWRR